MKRGNGKIAAPPGLWKILRFASNPAPKNPPQKCAPLLETQSNGCLPQTEAPRAEDCRPRPKNPKVPKAPWPTRRDRKPVSAIPSRRQTKQTQTLSRQFEPDTIPANRRRSNAVSPPPEKHDCETDPAGRQPDHNPPARLAQGKIRKTTKRQRQTQSASNDATKRKRKSSSYPNSQTLKFQAPDAIKSPANGRQRKPDESGRETQTKKLRRNVSVPIKLKKTFLNGRFAAVSFFPFAQKLCLSFGGSSLTPPAFENPIF